MKNIIFALIFVSPPFLKKCILRWFCRARIGQHVHIGWFSTIMGNEIELGDFCEVRACTIIKCDGKIKLGAYSIVSNFVLIYGSGSVIFGDYSYIGPQSLINADEDVKIGNVSAIGSRCMIFTHGSFLPYTEGYWVKFSGVTIGDYVWIAAGVFIHAGVEVGNHVFVNSRSVLTKDIPSNKAVEGFPAQEVTSIQKIKRTMTPQRIDMAAKQMIKHFAEIILKRRLRIEISEDYDNYLSFHYRGRDYLIVCIKSNEQVPYDGTLDNDKHYIFLVNRQDWSPPFSKHCMIFDLTTMQTSYSGDKIFTELWRFMRMYFGVTFSYR